MNIPPLNFKGPADSDKDSALNIIRVQLKSLVRVGVTACDLARAINSLGIHRPECQANVTVAWTALAASDPKKSRSDELSWRLESLESCIPFAEEAMGEKAALEAMFRHQ